LTSRDLLVIGAGHLGRRIIRSWMSGAAGAAVLAETASSARHAPLKELGASVRLRSDPPPEPFANVVFCVPPSVVSDYASEATRAVGLWDGTGRLVMTSSTAVYAEQDGGECDEQAPTAKTDRARRLLRGEAPLLAAGGIVIRLAGLYGRERGPHRVFLRRGTSPRFGDGLLNLIHLDDAAALCIAALQRGRPGSTYLGSDGSPTTRERLTGLAAESGLFGPAGERCTFEGTVGPLGRRLQNELTRRELDWVPRHASFADWLESCRAG
jgi:nucleoside-diphosphate-sugar epimerase